MPLFYTNKVNENTRLAVWNITETEDFFLKTVSLRNEISHPHKRLQHLAGRYLLTQLEPEFPLDLLSISEAKKPQLPDERFHFSISHCGDFAAVILSKTNLVGIDVELVTEKLQLIKPKFLSPAEHELLHTAVGNEPDTRLLTAMWSAKEAMYKWYGKGSVDFKKNIVIHAIDFFACEGSMETNFRKEKNTALKVEFRFFGNLCLAWIDGKQG